MNRTADVATTQPRAAALIAVTETEAAQALGFSIHWLRKDRRNKRLIPFYRVGRAIRYNLDRVRDALAAYEEGGAAAPRRRAATKSTP